MAFIEQGIFDAHFQPCARVTHNANQSTTTGVSFTLAFNTERFDTDTIHDTVTNNSRLTCKTAGKYLVTGNVSFAANATGIRQLQIKLNGATTVGAVGWSASSAGTTDLVVVTLYDMAVNDYVELIAAQNSGGALNVLATGNYSPEFMMHRVG